MTGLLSCEKLQIHLVCTLNRIFHKMEERILTLWGSIVVLTPIRECLIIIQAPVHIVKTPRKILYHPMYPILFIITSVAHMFRLSDKGQAIMFMQDRSYFKSMFRTYIALSERFQVFSYA